MSAAVEDAKRFLDMDKTGMVIVEEKTIVARSSTTGSADRREATPS